MPAFNNLGRDKGIDCDPHVIWDHNRDRKATYGFISQLQIGKHKFKTNWKQHVPGAKNKHHILVVLTRYIWDGGQESPMGFEGYCTPHVKNEIHGLLGKHLNDSSLELKFHVLKYTAVKHGKLGGHSGYFEARHSKNEVKAKICLASEVEQLDAKDPSAHLLMLQVHEGSAADPERCPFAIWIKPHAGHENHIQVADTQTHKHAKPWGHHG
jgi:hypothetical protein